MTAPIRSIRRADPPDAGPGFVEAVEEGYVVVNRHGATVRCLNALASLYEPHVGDAVLVVRGSAGEAYVAGVLVRSPVVETVGAMETVTVAGVPGTPMATLSDGTTVHTDGVGLSVRDARGALVFEHRAGERKSVLHVPRGDLEIRADEGDISLHAGGTVRLHGDTGLELGACGRVGIGVKGPGAATTTRMELTPERATLTAAALDVRTVRAEVTVDDGRVMARTLSTVVETSRVVAGVIDTTVTRAVTRAQNVFQEVEELAQMQAGRMRTLVRGTYHLFGRRAVVKADEDVKIKGDKIHLG